MKKKNKLSLSEIKKILKNHNNKVVISKNMKSFSYTSLFSLTIILLFFISPKIINFTSDRINNSMEVKNRSKTNLEKVLKNKILNNNQNDQVEPVDNSKIFEDIFQYEEVPIETIRLSASTIEQLFKDTNYNLDDVRKYKLVKPITIDLLPKEIKMIENIKKRKNLFIQIVLPLILYENMQIKIDREKLFTILNKNNNSDIEKKWLNVKFKQYGVNNKDLLKLKIRMDEVPVSLAIAQAAKETGWGTSRFALEGNALFGQWTFSGEGLKPLLIDSDKSHKVMKFQVLKASIKAYQRNLNTHSSYKKFRKLRAEARDNDEKLDSLILSDCLDKYAATGEEYTKVLKKIIKQNSLQDFDDVKLLPTSKKLKNLI
ncbi:glucosaminidase domain-containing protein [Candidatus Pelagibacter sp.]|nr:glucosaminidase domain-containing protein [Candidatus Pelagibacter sp.]